MKDYYKDDEYWRKNINKELEDDYWIEEYKEYLTNKGKCLDLACGIGQYTKYFMDLGYDVTSADISEIALNKVKTFNKNIVKFDMREPFPFEDESFDMVYANLALHYFSDKDTKFIIGEIKRILKKGGMLIGSVNGLDCYANIRDKFEEIEPHFYYYDDKYYRLSNVGDVKRYLKELKIIKIDEKSTVRFGFKKNYIIFVAKK